VNLCRHPQKRKIWSIDGLLFYATPHRCTTDKSVRDFKKILGLMSNRAPEEFGSRKKPVKTRAKFHLLMSKKPALFPVLGDIFPEDRLELVAMFRERNCMEDIFYLETLAEPLRKFVLFALEVRCP
jgi:hypothetical protein